MTALSPRSLLERLRNRPLYLDLRWSTREGLHRAWYRRRMQRKILETPAVDTAASGPVEVRVLTWRRDCLDLIWALKSFYFFSRFDYPLYIHDGGLAEGQSELLRKHFPGATIISCADADREVPERLRARGLKRCLAYRAVNITTRKLFDFFLLSSADYVVSIDSDIVFFRNPELLSIPSGGLAKNRYNKDDGYWYSMTLEELESNFGIKPPPSINSGLSIVRSNSINFDLIEQWLENPKLAADRWVTEQTLQALCSTVHGMEFLPDTYAVSTRPGLRSDTVCKHYTGFFRHLHYEEGMKHLVETGFLDDLRRSGAH